MTSLVFPVYHNPEEKRKVMDRGPLLRKSGRKRLMILDADESVIRKEKTGTYRSKYLTHGREKNKGTMILDFTRLDEMTAHSMNGGKGDVRARMYTSGKGKIIVSVLPPHSSIGLHTHTTSDDISYVIRGRGKSVCDGREETLESGCCHISPKGSEHSIENPGEEDLVLFTVVCERKDRKDREN